MNVHTIIFSQKDHHRTLVFMFTCSECVHEIIKWFGVNSVFFCDIQYLGSAPVTKTHGPGSTDDAVKAIVHHVSPMAPVSVVKIKS